MSPHVLLTVTAAFLSAVLSGMGVGSAGIFVLYLTLIAGFPQPEAQAVNLLFFLLSAGASLLLHVKKREIPWRTTLLLILCAIPGALAGSFLATRLDGDLLRRLFGGMLTATGLYTLLRPAVKTRKRHGTPPQESAERP
jgi:uncharacterized membrane protein YfcA